MVGHDVVAAPERDRVRTITSVLDDAARATPDAVYLIDGDSEYSFAETLERSDVVRRRLAGLGITAGDRVVVWMPNGISWIASFFGVLRCGAIVVPAGTRLRAADLEHVLADSEARALFFTPSFLAIDYDAMVVELLAARDRGRLPALEHVIAAGPTSVVGSTPLDGPSAVALPELDPQPDDLAIACYTSGTTGRPKGCLHTHASLVENARIAAGLTGLGPGERVACSVPFAHVFGFHMGVLQCAISGAALINAEPHETERYLDICSVREATVAYQVPTMAREMATAQARRPRDLALRLSLIAGAPVSEALRRDTLGSVAAGISVTYGCTEAPTIAQLLPSDPIDEASDSVGRPTPGIEVRIARQGTDEPLVPGEVGEILVRGYNTMHGYLGDPESTRRRFRDGWLVTGDLGSLDQSGYLRIAGRADDTLLVGGFNVYPREIEAQLEALAGVDEVAVIGVPDARLGQVPMAWVVSESIDSDRVLAWSRLELASHKRPRHVRMIARLPRVGSGKVARAELVQRARAELADLPWEQP